MFIDENRVRNKRYRIKFRIIIDMASEKSIGIIGYGDIGMNIAKKVKQGLDMKVMALARNPSSLSEDKK